MSATFTIEKCGEQWIVYHHDGTWPHWIAAFAEEAEAQLFVEVKNLMASGMCLRDLLETSRKAREQNQLFKDMKVATVEYKDKDGKVVMLDEFLPTPVNEQAALDRVKWKEMVAETLKKLMERKESCEEILSAHTGPWDFMYGETPAEMPPKKYEAHEFLYGKSNVAEVAAFLESPPINKDVFETIGKIEKAMEEASDKSGLVSNLERKLFPWQQKIIDDAELVKKTLEQNHAMMQFLKKKGVVTSGIGKDIQFDVKIGDGADEPTLVEKPRD